MVSEPAPGSEVAITINASEICTAQQLYGEENWERLKRDRLNEMADGRSVDFVLVYKLPRHAETDSEHSVSARLQTVPQGQREETAMLKDCLYVDVHTEQTLRQADIVTDRSTKASTHVSQVLLPSGQSESLRDQFEKFLKEPASDLTTEPKFDIEHELYWDNETVFVKLHSSFSALKTEV